MGETKHRPSRTPLRLTICFDLVGDVDHLAALSGFKDQILGVTLHGCLPACAALDGSGSAIILKKAVTATNPPNADELCQRGIDLLAAGRAAEAAEAFRAAIGADAAHVEAHHGLVRALRDAGRLEQSVGAALALTALTPAIRWRIRRFRSACKRRATCRRRRRRRRGRGCWSGRFSCSRRREPVSASGRVSREGGGRRVRPERDCAGCTTGWPRHTGRNTGGRRRHRLK